MVVMEQNNSSRENPYVSVSNYGFWPNRKDISSMLNHTDDHIQDYQTQVLDKVGTS